MRLSVYLGGAVGGLLLIIAAFLYGVSSGEAREARVMQRRLDRIAVADARLVRSAQALDQVAAARDTRRDTINREIVREVPRIVVRAVYRAVCIDADGVRLVERAVAAANGGDPAGRPDDPAGRVRAAADQP